MEGTHHEADCPPPLNKLCTVCHELITTSALLKRRRFEPPFDHFTPGAQEAHKHHSSLAQLIECAKAECHLCCLLWDALEDSYQRGNRRNPFHDSGSESLESAEPHCLIDGVYLRRISRHEDTYRRDMTVFAPMQKFCVLKISTGNLERRLVTQDSQQGYVGEVAIDRRRGNCLVNLLRSFVPESQLDKVRDTLSIEQPATCIASWDTSSEEHFQLIKSWIEECITTHSGCRRRVQNGMLPQRLLYLDRKNGTSPRIRVVKTSELSDSDLCTQMEHSLDQKQLSAMFNDAIWATVMLGYTYLWIDSLCIVQDGPDKASELGRMGDIYGNAVCTLTADVDNGRLFCVRAPRFFHPCSLPKPTPNGTYACRIGEVMPSRGLLGASQEPYNTSVLTRGYDLSCVRDRVLESSPLESRGWVFQERCLSPRVIHFGPQLYWECNTCEGTEGRAEGRPLPPLRFKYMTERLNWRRAALLLSQSSEQRIDCSSHDFFHCWHWILEKYTECDLSFATDRLPGLLGVIIQISTGKDLRSVCGLWEADLASELLWTVKPALGRSRQPAKDMPSWSWASLDDAPINYFVVRNHHLYAKERDRPQYVSCIEVLTTPESLSRVWKPFNKSNAGCLKLRTKLMGCLEKLDGDFPISIYLDRQREFWDGVQFVVRMCYLMPILVLGKQEVRKELPWIVPCAGLILMKAEADDSLAGQRVYRRIGAFSTHNEGIIFSLMYREEEDVVLV
ncbi:hypothetical protein BP5796_12147 [Coleophoma crateriformis]|uniref:Heterokaryon incompatibility domain-containing protein n=1 Tax=Coleophoma crateriformis TaxID=565419 RepID=A0A3D8QBJ8_9HELO|nr:hypothetical protein BP5796_12147 [Coleophoma crateriformis]